VPPGGTVLPAASSDLAPRSIPMSEESNALFIAAEVKKLRAYYAAS
jgi:hypothetical protein